MITSITQKTVYIHFEDGPSFKGKLYNTQYPSSDLEEGQFAEAAFTTAMTGYQETMTDPSYLGQHIIFATAHVGNYPEDQRVMQSKAMHASSIIARNISENSFIREIDKPAVTGVDTRALVKYLTKAKKHNAVITTKEKNPGIEWFAKQKLICSELNRVSQDKAEVIFPGEKPIVLMNYGVKNAIVECLKKLGLPLVTLPYNASFKEIEAYEPRLVFLSNGPGDPSLYQDQVAVIKEVVKAQYPIRAICLGHQLLAQALGAKTYKLPFGHRGINHPVLDAQTGKVLITSQNHGYSVDEDHLLNIFKESEREFYVSHKSLFDTSIEGIASTDHLIKTVQYHPEANPGPLDARVFFEEVGEYLNEKLATKTDTSKLHKVKTIEELKEKKVSDYKKILLIGSGPIKIGQASEFDYSGTQACRALTEMGVDVILLNSNPATIMTDRALSHKTYIEPITADTIKKIIEKEKVEAILSTMGGQTALNTCIELDKSGYLESAGVALLGAKADTIERTEDRELFSAELDKLGYKTGERYECNDANEVRKFSKERTGLPLLVRRNFALGGKGSSLIQDQKELELFLEKEKDFPLTIEKSLIGYKEVELEVMVDNAGNGVIVCSIENIDPCGIHTGDSITVAPVQTISDRCYQNMRTISLNIAKHMGVVAGGANVQFAINPDDEDDIIVIEMNPRVSRSSALASKATGYPIAKISTGLALGLTLKDILNDITKASPVCFEPTQDYVSVKIPLFPFSKFPISSQRLGPQMRAVGEVLALGQSFNEAFFKALRSLEIGLDIPSLHQLKETPHEIDTNYLKKRLKDGHQLSLLTALHTLKREISVNDIYNISGISHWFLEQMNDSLKLRNFTKEKRAELLTNPELLRMNKSNGLSDKAIAVICDAREKDVFLARQKFGIKPVFKSVDTCSGEFDAKTPYHYATYGEFEYENEVTPFKEKTYTILGSGPNRIGQGIEFDYSCVKACEAIKEEGHRAIMINSNPETVSTDYDTSDRLYMAPLHSEDLFDILESENPEGIIACFSGQTGIGVREHLDKSFLKEAKAFNFLGLDEKALEETEDRKLFARLLQDLPIERTKCKEITTYKQLMDSILDIGLPVIIRPNYVIGGESMFIFRDHKDIENLPDQVKRELNEGRLTFQVEQYLDGAYEYDVDLIRDNFNNCIFAITEHIEHAGVHSGDSGMITPPIHLKPEVFNRLREISILMAQKLDVTGPINIQYAVKGDKIYCIEANPRGSRTIPFLSKAYNISLASLAVKAMLGEKLPPVDIHGKDYYCVKQSTFPFDRFPDDSIILGPKMMSTGETMGVDHIRTHAILKSYLGNFDSLLEGGAILLSFNDTTKEEMFPYVKTLSDQGYKFYATKGTCSYLKEKHVECTEVKKIDEEGPTLTDLLKNQKVIAVLNTPNNMSGSSLSQGEKIRKLAIANNIPCFTRNENVITLMDSLAKTSKMDLRPTALQELK